MFVILRFVTILCLLLGNFAFADVIYFHVGQNGVPSFTNVPTDSRYRPTTEERRSKRMSSPRLNSIISNVSNMYQIDSHLVKAVIKAESDFDYKAVSDKGALGLMQLMPHTATEFGVFDPLDPQQNIRGGVRYLKQLLVKFDGNIYLALAAYNAGPDQVNKHNGIPPFEETRTFVDRVLGYYTRYKQYGL